MSQTNQFLALPVLIQEYFLKDNSHYSYTVKPD